MSNQEPGGSSAADRPAEPIVVDASVIVDLLAGTPAAAAAKARLATAVLNAPAHVDAEALSALGRLHRAGELTTPDMEVALEHLRALPVHRHELSELLLGAWARRDRIRLVDALYVELAARLGVPLVTTDHRLARTCTFAETLTSP